MPTTSKTHKEPPQAFLWKPRVIVACGQMQANEDLERNRRVALKQIEEAARKHKAKLIVLPETCLSGYGPAHWLGGLAAIDYFYLKDTETAVRNAASKFKIAVTVGTTVREGTPTKPKYFNTALQINESGEVLHRYDKMHLTGTPTRTLDAAVFEFGSVKNLRVIEQAGLKTGTQICMDMRYPEGWRLLALAGAKVFLHPTACFGRDQLWKTDPVHANMSSRASENGCWFLSANLAGPFQFATSRIIDPDGIVVVEAQTDCEQVISAGIDPEFHGRGNFLPGRRTDIYRLEKR